MLPYTTYAKTHDIKESYSQMRATTYDLISVVVHVGEMDTGHYVSYCRVGDQVSLDALWALLPANLNGSGSLSMITGSNWLPFQMSSTRRPICCSISSEL